MSTTENHTAHDEQAEKRGWLPREEFTLAFRNHPAGVAVVTADAGSGPVALTATSVSSVSAEPPLLIFSVSAQSSSTPTILEADTVVVHLLAADQVHLAVLGATSGVDRFADTNLWKRLPTGETYFPAAHTWMRCLVVDTMKAGASTIVAVQAIEGSIAQGGDEAGALVYHNRTWHQLGSHSAL